MLASVRRNIIAGIFIVIPVWVTIWVITFLTNLLIEFGTPVTQKLAQLSAPSSPGLAALFQAVWFQDLVAVILILVGLLLLGVVGRAVIGRRLLEAFDRVMARIPLVQSIYGAARKLVQTVQTK